MNDKIPFVPKRGMVITRDNLGTPEGSFSSLVNVRLNPNGTGLEQTPPWYAAVAHTAGSYYDSGTQTEPSTNIAALLVHFQAYSKGVPTPLNNNFLWAGRYGAWFGTTQLQVIKQTSVPASETVYTNCLLVVNNYTSLGITLGSTLEVVVEAGGATFKWRKNGGAYTTALACSTSGTSIDGGNATVYFLASSGLTSGDTWVWTRSDWFTESAGNIREFDWSWVAVDNKIYFCDYYNRVMVYENSGIRSMGYRPIYGDQIAIFENHLIVGNYATSASTTITSVVGNSDLNNFDCFFATDTNEADTKFLAGSEGTGNRIVRAGVRGFWVKNSQLFVFCSNTWYSTQYYGLPAPFSFKQNGLLRLSNTFSRLLATESKVYLIAQAGIYAFDGAQMTLITRDLEGLWTYYTDTSRSLTALFDSIWWPSYDPTRNEVYFHMPDFTLPNTTPFGVGGAIVYNEVTEQWYFRALSFSDKYPRSMAMSNGVLNVGMEQCVYREDPNWSRGSQTMFGDSTGNAFVVPTAITNDIDFEDISLVKECYGGYLEGYYAADTGSYGTSNIKVEISARTSAGATPSYGSSSTWTTSSKDGTLLDVIPLAGHLFRLKFTFNPTTSKVTRNARISKMLLYMRNLPNKKEPTR